MGSAGVALGLLWGGKDGSPSPVFPIADGRLRGPAPGGPGEERLPTLPRRWGCSEPRAPLALKPPFLFPQPGKLTEAFKYFVQGMGYSKWQTEFSGLEQGCCEGNSACLVHLSPLASVSPPMS